MTHTVTTMVEKARPAQLRILVIEDDPRWRTLVELQLQAAGHTVLTAADGLAGLALAAEKPDVILCDVEMPRLNGYGVLEALRQQPGLGDIPFIFLTGRTARAEQRKNLEQSGTDSFARHGHAGRLHRRFGCDVGGRAAVGRAAEAWANGEDGPGPATPVKSP